MKAKTLQYELTSLDKLIPYARNARTHSGEQVAQIAASIKEFGFLNPVIIGDDGTIIAGHGRVLAARQLGLDKVPTLNASHLTDAQRRAYILADNKLALNAGWDFDMLRIEIDELKMDNFNLDLTGFSLGEINNIFLDRADGKTDAHAEWDGMPDYEDQDPCFRKIIVNFDTQGDVDKFFELIGQEATEKTKSIWFPEKERRDLESKRWAEDALNDE